MILAAFPTPILICFWQMSVLSCCLPKDYSDDYPILLSASACDQSHSGTPHCSVHTNSEQTCLIPAQQHSFPEQLHALRFLFKSPTSPQHISSCFSTILLFFTSAHPPFWNDNPILHFHLLNRVVMGRVPRSALGLHVQINRAVCASGVHCPVTILQSYLLNCAKVAIQTCWRQ